MTPIRFKDEYSSGYVYVIAEQVCSFRAYHGLLHPATILSLRNGKEITVAEALHEVATKLGEETQ